MDVMDFTDDMKTIQLSKEGSFAELRKHLNTGNQKNIDFQNEDGDTALIWAARRGHMNIVRNLLCHKANIHLTNNRGTTAIEEASTEEIKEEIRNFQGRLTKGAR